MKHALATFGVRKDAGEVQGCPLRVDYDSVCGRESKPPLAFFIDPDAMVSAVRNLLTNSVEQYKRIGRKGPLEISTCFKEVEGESAAQVVVKDYAGGVSEQMRGKMWEPFETDKPGGAGIGLFSVQTIVQDKMGGTVQEVGQHGAAEFVITLYFRDGGE